MPSSAEILKIANLLETGGEELGEFAHKVGQRNGKIPILVHPFFAEDVAEKHPFLLFRKRPGYKLGRDKFIKACLENAIPLIIFEQENEYTLLPERIKETHGTLYTVITGERNHLPRELENQGVQEWDKLIAILRLAHVKHIQVGGQYLILLDSHSLFNANPRCVPESASQIFQWKTPDKLSMTTGCVGALAKRLARENFVVSLSPISSPRQSI